MQASASRSSLSHSHPAATGTGTGILPKVSGLNFTAGEGTAASIVRTFNIDPVRTVRS